MKAERPDPHFEQLLKKQVETITTEQTKRKYKKRDKPKKEPVSRCPSKVQTAHPTAGQLTNKIDVSHGFLKTYNWRIGLPEARAIDVADSMIIWFQQNPEVLTLRAFLIASQLSWNEFKRLVDRSEYLSTAKKNVLMILADRREVGGLKGVYHAGLVAHSMPMYDPEWKEREEEKAILKGRTERSEPVRIEVVDLTRKE